MSASKQKKIAVIGSGISGLSAAYILGRSYEVHLFEAAPRLGGHANTVTVTGARENTSVDTGFIVFNELNYPHLTAFFKHLGVPVAPSEMTLSVKFRDPDLEWGGTTLRAMVAQKRNILRPKFWSMVTGILRFNREAVANMEESRSRGWSLRDLLRARKYGQSFKDWYLVPMAAAIWSTPPSGILDFPAETFLQFCLNHRLLQVNGRPEWKTVNGGSIEYVRRVAAELPHVHLNSPVKSVVRTANGIELNARGEHHAFDAVVFATHAPVTRAILQNQLRDEAAILGSFTCQPNRVHLHSDTSFMPERKSIWSAWNFHQQKNERAGSPVSLSYWMNRLQPLNSRTNFILSLNSESTPREAHFETEYDHPVFTRKAIEAQSLLGSIQGRGGIYYCGAWTRYGFSRRWDSERRECGQAFIGDASVERVRRVVGGAN